MTFKCLFASLWLSFILSPCVAQHSLVGDWRGALVVKKTALHLVFHIQSDNAGNLLGTWDSPDQGAFDLPCSGISSKNDTVRITMDNIKGYYKGFFTSDSTITGLWLQNGSVVPMSIRRTTAQSVYGDRPQTPKPPFDYTVRDVIYYNGDSTIRFGASITIPKGNGPFPAVLLITGSGQQNRDEEMMGHKPFAVIADYLTKRGYVVMRVDDRGTGLTTGDVPHATSLDFSNDAWVSFNYLKKLPEVDKHKIGLMGHSEGGMIAEMLAAQHSEVNFIVLLAAPGIPIPQLMNDQVTAYLQSEGDSMDVIKSYLGFYNKVLLSSIALPDTAVLHAAIADAIRQWRATTPPDHVSAVTFIKDDSTAAKYAEMETHAFSTPWWRYFLAFDPATYLQKLKCRVLALNGSRDIQVVPKSNLAGIERALKKGKNKNYTVLELPGLNHLFQECKDCTLNEYGNLEQTFAPSALDTIAKWLDKQVK
jgi:uncharacterized protein